MEAKHAPILVAVDFSPDSKAAFEWALRAALAFGAPLLVLHVAHDPATAPGSYVRAGDEGSDLEGVATQMLADYVASMREKFPEVSQLEGFTHRLVVGLPVGRILETASQEGARLIVMGGCGRSGFTDVLLGSKVERVARLAQIPVTIVRSERASKRSD